MNPTTATRAKAARGRLTGEAYHYVRDGIMRGAFPTGSILAETEIANASRHRGGRGTVWSSGSVGPEVPETRGIRCRSVGDAGVTR